MKAHVRRKCKKPACGLLHRVFLFLLGLTVPFAIGWYHGAVNGGEGYHRFYTFPKSRARPLVLKYGADGVLHRWISHNALDGTLGLTNAGRPVKIRMEMEEVPEGLKIHWENSHTRDFDLASRTVQRVLNPGDSVSVHHTFHIGESLRGREVIFDGGLKITNAATGKTLLRIPIRILNTGASRLLRAESDHEE